MSLIRKIKEARRADHQSGQGLTEYAIVVALVGIAAIGVVSLYGDNIRLLFGASTDALAGNEAVRIKTQGAHGLHGGHKNLKNFAQDNTGAT